MTIALVKMWEMSARARRGLKAREMSYLPAQKERRTKLSDHPVLQQRMNSTGEYRQLSYTIYK